MSDNNTKKINSYASAKKKREGEQNPPLNTNEDEIVQTVSNPVSKKSGIETKILSMKMSEYESCSLKTDSNRASIPLPLSDHLLLQVRCGIESKVALSYETSAVRILHSFLIRACKIRIEN